MKQLLLIMVSLLLTGCSGNWTPHSPPVDDLLDPPYATTLHQPPALNRPWWTTLADQQLNELMAELFRSNLDLKAAASRIRQAEASITRQRAATLPWLTLAGSAQRLHQPGATADQTGNDLSLQVTAGYEVDLWNKLESQVKAAEHQLTISRAERDGLLLSLSAELASRYVFYQEQTEQLRLADEQRLLRQRYRDFVRQRYQQGLEPSASLYQADQAVALAHNVVQNLQTNQTSAKVSIALLLGRRHNDLVLKPQPTPVRALPPHFALPADLLLQRPDLIASWQRLAVADQQLATAIADRLPQLSLQATAGLLHNSLSHSTINDLFWRLTASALQPLIDGGHRQALVEQQQALVEQRSFEARQALLQAISEVEQQLNDIAGQQQRTIHLEQRLLSAQAHDAQLRQRYNRGLNGSLPWLEAHDATLSAQRQLVEARYQLLNHTIQLTRAIGGKWMKRIVAAKESA